MEKPQAPRGEKGNGHVDDEEQGDGGGEDEELSVCLIGCYAR